MASGTSGIAYIHATPQGANASFVSIVYVSQGLAMPGTSSGPKPGGGSPTSPGTGTPNPQAHLPAIPRLALQLQALPVDLRPEAQARRVDRRPQFR